MHSPIDAKPPIAISSFLTGRRPIRICRDVKSRCYFPFIDLPQSACNDPAKRGITMRYAIYFTPPSGDALLKVAGNWLGRSAFSGEPVKVPAIRTLAAEDIVALTEEPRRYGFH